MLGTAKALYTSPCTASAWPSTVSRRARTESGSVASTGAAIAVPPARRTSSSRRTASAISSTREAVRAATTTDAPCAEARRASV